MSAVGFSRFLSLLFSFVKVENPVSHKCEEGDQSKILFLLRCGYSLETLIQNDDRGDDRILILNDVSLVR